MRRTKKLSFRQGRHEATVGDGRPKSTDRIAYVCNDLREPANLAKLRVGIAMAQRNAEYEESKVAQADAKLQTARSDGARLRLRSQIDRAAAAAREYRAEERALREQLASVLGGTGFALPEPSVTPRLPPKARAPRTAKTTAAPSPQATAPTNGKSVCVGRRNVRFAKGVTKRRWGMGVPKAPIGSLM